MFGWLEIVLIIAVVLVVFGGRKLPPLARGIGAAMRNYKAEVAQPSEDEAPNRVPDAEIESRRDLE